MRRDRQHAVGKSTYHEKAFTLVEIMVVIAVIGLLAALAMPGFVKVRKQAQGKRIISDARVIDEAIGLWALENGKSDGDVVNLTQVGALLKSREVSTNDVLGNAYIIGAVGSNQVLISSTTKSSLSGVSVDWGAY